MKEPVVASGATDRDEVGDLTDQTLREPNIIEAIRKHQNIGP